MVNLFTSAFFLLDFYKSPFYFKIKGNSKTTSKIGSILSFGILAFIFYSLMTCDVFKKNSPNITAQDLNLETPLRLTLTKENFDVKIGVTNYFGKAFFPDPAIFKMSFIQQTSFEDFSEMQSQPCNLVYPEKEYLQNFLCMTEESFILEKDIQSEDAHFFSVVLSICNNSTDKAVCKSVEEIKEFLNGKYFSIIYNVSTFDIYNYEKPVKQIENLEMMAISIEISRQFLFFLKPLDFRTDDAFIFENDKVNSGFQLESKFLDFQFVNISNMNNVTNYVAGFLFFNTNKMYRILRKYQKIDTVLASIGGVINIFVIMGSIITGIQSYLNSMQLIMNSLYSFYSKENLKRMQFTAIAKEMKLDNSRRSFKKQEENTSQLKIDLKIENEKHLSEIMEENKNDKIDTSLYNFKKRFKQDFKQNVEMKKIERVCLEDEKPPDLNQSFHEYKPDTNNSVLVRKRMKSIKIINHLQTSNLIKENIVISFIKYLRIKLKNVFKMNLSYQENLIVKTEEIFNEEIEVEHILKKLKDIDKLKALLFNEKQINMFDFLAKPMIYLENYINAEEKSHPHFTLNNSIPNDKNSIKNIMEYYDELLNSDPDKLSYIDKNILKYAENIFEKFNKVLS